MKNKILFYTLPIIVLVLAVVGIMATQPANSLTIDVNPSIEIVTNRLDRVVEINPLNDDAKELLAGFEPKDKKLEGTVNDLVDLMILTGHIKGGEDNFVMITVSDDSVDGPLVDKVNRAIKAMLENKYIEATILNQAIAESERAGKETGVQIAARRLEMIDRRITAGQIESMTVGELINYSKKHDIPIESLFKVAVGDLDKSATKTLISREEAEKIALDKVDGEIIKVQLDDRHDDDPEYEIKVRKDGAVYEFEIDAYTGRIKEFEKDDDYDDSIDASKGNRTIITKEAASKIALGKINGEIIKIELDNDDDDPEYEIKVRKDGAVYEFEIDAYTGRIKEFEKEDDDDDISVSQGNRSIITKEAASKIALDKVNGEIIKIELDDDDDDPEYKIKVKKDGAVYEFEIDAYTGRIKEFERDDD